jgi:hypothetical protein
MARQHPPEHVLLSVEVVHPKVLFAKTATHFKVDHLKLLVCLIMLLRFLNHFGLIDFE